LWGAGFSVGPGSVKSDRVYGIFVADEYPRRTTNIFISGVDIFVRSGPKQEKGVVRTKEKA
jgi:hypothetical protein